MPSAKGQKWRVRFRQSSSHIEARGGDAAASPPLASALRLSSYQVAVRLRLTIATLKPSLAIKASFPSFCVALTHWRIGRSSFKAKGITLARASASSIPPRLGVTEVLGDTRSSQVSANSIFSVTQALSER